MIDPLFGPVRSTEYARAADCPREFWCGNWFFPDSRREIPDGSTCCFNHWIGLPRAENMDTERMERHPLYDFQEELIRMITSDVKRLYAIMKSPKLGITEFWIRFMLWKCLVDPVWQFGQCMIVVATAGSEPQQVLKRCKDLLDNPHNPIPYNLGYRTNLNQFTVNNVDIFAYPPNNIDHLRSKTNPRFILLDEVAMFNQMVDDKKVKDAAEHYYGNRNYYLALVSTAGERAGGFFYNLIKDGDSKYNILKWTDPDRYGLKPHPDSGTSLYSRRLLEMEQENMGESYKRNYLGLVGHGAGDIFDSDIITEISSQKYDIPARFMRYPSALGVDPAYGRGSGRTGARFGIVGIYKKDGIYHTGFMRELRSPSGEEGRTAIHSAMRLGFRTLCIDAADQGLVKDMVDRYSVVQMKFSRLQDMGDLEMVSGENRKKYEEKQRMIDAVERLTCRDRVVRIHPDHRALTDQLRAIRRNARLLPDKTRTRFDLGDAFQMALYHLNRYGDGLGIV